MTFSDSVIFFIVLLLLKAGMVRVWVAGKTVWSPCYTRAISESFRDKELIIKSSINSSSLNLTYLYVFICAVWSRYCFKARQSVCMYCMCVCVSVHTKITFKNYWSELMWLDVPIYCVAPWKCYSFCIYDLDLSP